MFKRLTTLLAALMLLAFVVAGCGDDGDSDNSGSGGTAAETQSEDTTVEETDTAADDTAADDVTPPANLEEAVDRCKESLGQAPQLSDEAKSKLEDICERAGSGDEDEIRDAARDVCETIVEESIPEGSPGREAALSACAGSGGR